MADILLRDAASLSLADIHARIRAALPPQPPGTPGASPATSAPPFLLIGPDHRVLREAADLAALSGAVRLEVAHAASTTLAAPAKERIHFPPHPKTLTMAGDYEYFAAQGQHPFAYALAELIDNAMRATRNNDEARGREILISLVTAPGGLATIAVEDNGCGMTAQELNEWAVMNLSMQDRGIAPEEPAANARAGAAAAGAGAGRFLSGELSFFGVGSKNAAFFLGNSIQVRPVPSRPAPATSPARYGPRLARPRAPAP